jgi:hypothetical protein
MSKVRRQRTEVRSQMADGRRPRISIADIGFRNADMKEGNKKNMRSIW